MGSPRTARAPLYRAIEALTRLADVFDRRRQQLARDAGLTDPQWRVLERIGSDDFMPSLFARSQEAHPAAVSRTLRQLQERELITVAISAADGRQRQYALTAEGRRALDRLRTSRERAIDAVWAGLPARDLERFAVFAERLARRLERYARGEGDSGDG